MTKASPTPLTGAMVTGSSRGIGAAIAERLARAGHGVCVNYVESEDCAYGVVERIEAAGGRAIAVRADVGDYEDVVRLVAAAATAFGGIGIVVNNAGFSQHLVVGCKRKHQFL